MARVTDYRIVLSVDSCMNEKRAAACLSMYIKLIAGKKIPTVTDDTEPCDYEIVVGKTTREQLDGVEFFRSRDRVWEYEMKTVGKRLYLTGLGCAAEPAPYMSAYKLMDNGAIGTVYAANHFVEDILGYDFVYSAYDDYPENSEIEIPENYSFSYTTARLDAEMPEPIDGAAMYALISPYKLDWNTESIILKTRSGKLVVIDGGYQEDADHVIRALESLSPGKKPVVSAWLFSHLHNDHYGMYKKMVETPELAARVTVEHFYSHLLPVEFYTEISNEANEKHREAYEALVTADQKIGVQLHTVETGDVINVDELSFEVLHVPDMAYAKQMNFNDSSVVYKLTYDGSQTIMFLGDAEFVCNNDLMENARGKLKSDVVQVGHHGCGNVSKECYEAIGASVYIWPIGNRFWYGDNSEGLNTHNTGVIRMRCWARELGENPKNSYRNTNGMLSFKLPIEIR